MPKDFQTEMCLDYPRAKLMGNDSVMHLETQTETPKARQTAMRLASGSVTLMGSRTVKLTG